MNSFQEVREKKKLNNQNLTKHKYANAMYCDYCEKFIPFENIVWQQGKKLIIPKCPNNVILGICKGIKLRAGSTNLKTRRRFTKPKYIE